jgi:hypothetical protein
VCCVDWRRVSGSGSSNGRGRKQRWMMGQMRVCNCDASTNSSKWILGQVK